MFHVSPREHTLLLLAGVIGILSLASVVGFALKVTVARGAPHSNIHNPNSRVKAWCGVAWVIGLALGAGKEGVIALFAFASFVALREYATIAPGRRGDHW